jgi:hypothetical protein
MRTLRRRSLQRGSGGFSSADSPAENIPRSKEAPQFVFKRAIAVNHEMIDPGPLQFAIDLRLFETHPSAAGHERPSRLSFARQQQSCAGQAAFRGIAELQ